MSKNRIIIIISLAVSAIIAAIVITVSFAKLNTRQSAEAMAEATVESEAKSSEPESELELESESEPDTQLPPQEVNLIMVGDILLHTPVEESALRTDGTYDFSYIFENTKDDIAAADLALVNQEVMIGGNELGVSGYPAFNAPYEIADALVDAGFDVICQATNHALDKGKNGIINCVENWDSKYPDIAVLGINTSQEQQDDIYVYEKDGIRISILNYTYGTNGIALPPDMPYAVNMLEEEQVISDIEKAHQLSDFVVVCPHWGTEYSLEVSAEQERWAKLFLENGVDLVIGTHPHVIEPIELLSDGEHEMLVYYSLGNFVNWTSGEGDGVANRMLGGMAQVTIGYDEKGDLGITDYGVEPLVCHVQEGQDGVTVYKLDDYTPELTNENKIINQDYTFSYDYIKELSEEIWQQ